jgi:glycosyltransferase involved in cell wall biosynthesis
MKLIALTFAGRKRYMEILFRYILINKKHITEYHLYLATTNPEDVDYIYQFQRENNDFVKVIALDSYENFNKAEVWNLSYKNCLDDDTIYLKIDDDIVFIDDNLFSNFIEFRKNSTSPLVFPHIINNIISTPLLEMNSRIDIGMLSEEFVVNTWSKTIGRIKPQIEAIKGKFPSKDFVVTSLLNQNEILCPIAWGSLEYSRRSHLIFLDIIKEGTISNIYTDNIILEEFQPMSIQCCSWFGKDLKKYISEFGDVGNEDEPWMSVYLPIWLNSPHIIFGGSVVSHFSSYNQDQFLLNNGVLEEYKKISPSNG